MNDSQGPEWVERAVFLADEYVDAALGHHLGHRQQTARRALRAHLESREAEFQLLEKDITEFREAIALANERMDRQEALLEKERESRKEAQMENVRLKDHLARHGIEARAVLAKRDALVKQLVEALDELLEIDRYALARAALAAQQRYVALQEKT